MYSFRHWGAKARDIFASNNRAKERAEEDLGVAIHVCHFHLRLTGQNQSRGSDSSTGRRDPTKRLRVGEKRDYLAKSRDYIPSENNKIIYYLKNQGLSLENFCLLTSYKLESILNFK